MSTIAAGTTSGTALVNTGDTTGQLVLQTNGTTTAVTIGTNQVVTLAQPLPAGSGGTGATSLTANNVLLGNGTSALQVVAPGANGNLLTSNGTTWTSAAPAGGGAWTFISSVTASNSATVDFTGIGSTYDIYVITLTQVKPVGDGNRLQMRTSTNNGTTYDSGAVYSYSYAQVATSTGSASGNWDATEIELSGIGIGSSYSGVNGFVYLYKPSNSTGSQIGWQLSYVQSTSRTAVAEGTGTNQNSADIDAIRFFMNGGNISSGVFRLYGIKNS